MSSLKDEKLDVDEFKYDKSTRGWLGPIVAKRMMSSKISRLRANKKKQEESIAKTKLGVLKQREVSNVDVDLEDDEEDAASVDGENALEEPPIIKRPFSSNSKRGGNYANWRAPDKLKSERVEDFRWNKPAPIAESSSFISPSQNVIRLKEELRAKDKEMAVLRDQLMKAQRDNYDLAETLNRYEGDDYEKLKVVNATLKEKVDRVSRENIKLRGLMRQEQNSKLHKLELEKIVNEKHTSSIKSKNDSLSKSKRFTLPSNTSKINSKRGKALSSEKNTSPLRTSTPNEVDSDKDR